MAWSLDAVVFGEVVFGAEKLDVLRGEGGAATGVGDDAVTGSTMHRQSAVRGGDTGTLAMTYAQGGSLNGPRVGCERDTRRKGWRGEACSVLRPPSGHAIHVGRA